MNKRIAYTLLLIFLACNLFLTLNRHSRSGINNYHSEIWADKAGYYVYLPAFFIYDFNGKTMPQGIDKKTGNGFVIENGKIITKYTYGTALLQAPFFIVCHFFTGLSGLKNDGFTESYQKSINIAAVFYSFLSLIIIYLFLRRYLCKATSFYTVVCLFLGTNIFYYTIFDTGMSHIYSLFLFSAFIYVASLLPKREKQSDYLLLGLLAGLIIVVRPVNVIFLPVYFILNKLNFLHFKQNFRKYILAMVPVIILVIPQLWYWKYSNGNFFHYSYQSEHFTNALNPKLFYLWFSTQNGLFIFTPLVIFILSGFVFFYTYYPRESIFILVHFVIISYIFSSWHDWSYGCSFGCRPYVEYFSLLALPFGFFIDRIKTRMVFRPVIITLLIATILYHQKLIFTFDQCWYGGVWDWAGLMNLIIAPTK